MAADVEAARDALQTELKHVEPDAGSGSADDDEDGEAPVSLSTRAVPLLELLQSAIENGDNVMWE